MSVPIPKQKIRVLDAWSRTTFATMRSSSVSPIVGFPSVKKTTTKGRDESAGFSFCAASSASAMAVPPMGLSFVMKSSALSRFAFVASVSFSNSGSASVEKRTISKRSASFRFSTQKVIAFFACSSFLPAIEPLVSKTKTTSFGFTSFAFAISAPGDASSRNQPSSPGFLCVSRCSPTSVSAVE